MNLLATALPHSGPALRPVWELGLAFALSTVIGLEREVRNKSAGLRTHTIVGTSAALITLVGAYGFPDLVDSLIRRDPTRVAAQIVSGIGFIGGGVIFVRRDAVRGLTTAAVVWEAAAIGMACAAGLPLLALLTTAGHFLVVYGYTAIVRRLSMSQVASRRFLLTFREGSAALRDTLVLATTRGFTVERVSVNKEVSSENGSGKGREGELWNGHHRGEVSVLLDLAGAISVNDFIAAVTEHRDVLAVSTVAVDDSPD
jgi:putative Mg2+ transporter-C (MgtC) family protein